MPVDNAVQRAQAAYERAMSYGGASGSAPSAAPAAPEQAPGPLTNPNLFGGATFDPSAAADLPVSPWSSYGIEPAEEESVVNTNPYAQYYSGGVTDTGTAAVSATPMSYAEQMTQGGQQYGIQQEVQQRLDADITAVQEARFEDVQNYKDLAELAITGVNSEDEAYRAMAQQLMHELKDVEAFTAIFNVLDEGRTFEDYYEPPKEAGRVLKGIAWLGEKLDKTSQWGLNMLADLKREDYGSAARRTGEGLADLVDAASSVGGEVTGLGTLARIADSVGAGQYGKFIVPDYWTRKVTDEIENFIPDPRDNSNLDVSGDGRLSFLEAVGVDPEWGQDVGWRGLNAGNAVNLAGEIVFDPSTYVTFGAGGAAGAAAKSGREVLEDIGMNFGESLVRQGMLKADELSRLQVINANLRSGTPWKKFAQEGDREFVQKVLSLQAVSRTGEMGAAALSASQAKHIQRTAKAIEKRAGGGAYFAAQPIPGTRAVSQGLRKTGLIGQRWTPVAGTAPVSRAASTQYIDDALNELTRRADELGWSDSARQFWQKEIQSGNVRTIQEFMGQPMAKADSGIGAIGDDIVEPLYTSIRRESSGALLGNPAVDKVRHFTNGLFKTFARVSNVDDEARARVLRQVSGDIATKVENRQLEWTNSLVQSRRIALKEVKAKFGLTGDAAERYLNEEIARIRGTQETTKKATRRNRVKAVDELRSSGRNELANLIELLDQTSVEMKTLVREIGYNTKKWNPLNYAPRNISQQTVKMLDDIKQEGGELWDAILDASKGEGSTLVDDMVARGILSADDAKSLGSLLGRWTQRPVSEISDEVPDELMSLHSFLVGNRSGKKRTFMEDTKNILDVNDTIAKLFAEIGERGGSKAVITEFYDIDPVDGFIRYMDGFSSEMVAHDLFNELKDLTISSVKSGKNRNAVVEGKRSSVPALDEFGQEIPDEYVTTYTWVDPSDGVSRTLSGSSDEDLVKQVRESLTDSHYQIRPVGSGKFYLVDADILDAFENTIVPRLKKAYIEGSMMRNINKWNAIWASHATVPLVGAAFHARNSIGNWFNMALAGFKNPALLGDAANLQAVNKAVQHHMRQGVFTSWDDAADDLVANGINPTVGRIATKVTPDNINTLRMLRDNGAINGSFFSDLKTDRILFSGADQKNAALAKLTDNAMVRSGQAVGATVENNARIALFLDGIDKGMTPAASSRRVKQFLFDYSDLTPFEDQKLRTLSRFYTYMRKNTELQMRMMVSYPGSVWNTQKTLDAVMGGIFGDDGDPRQQGLFLPEFMEDAGFMFNAQDSFVHGYETPLTAAIDTLSGVLGTVAVIPGGKAALPPELQRNTLAENFSSTLALMASGPTTLLNYLYENATGTDTFTQAPINDSIYAQAIGFVESLLPSVSKSAREFERFQGLKYIGIDDEELLGGGLVSEHQEGRAGLRMMNLMLGMNVYSLNEEQQARALGAIGAMYEDLRRDLRSEGMTAPTMEELREAGKIAQTNMYLNALLFSEDPAKSMDSALPAAARELVMRELGMSIEMMDDGEKTFAEMAEQAEQFYQIVEYRIGRKLTERERWQLGFQMPGTPANAELEALGLNPFRENQFAPEEDTLYNVERAKQWLAAMAPTWGMTPEEAIAANPLLSEAQIYMSDALAAGQDPETAVRNYVAELSRTRRAQLFGVDSLEEFDFEKSMTADERVALNARIQQDAMQYMTLASFFGFPMTYQAAVNYVNYGADRLLQGERELLGIDTRQSIPNREDPRSEQERQTEAGMTFDQIQGSVGEVLNNGGLSPVAIPPASLDPYWSNE